MYRIDQLLSPIFIEINGDSPISSNDSNVDNGVLHEETIIDSVFDVGAMRNTGNKRKKTNNRFSNDSVHAGEEVVECEEISLLNDENMVVTTNVLMNSDDYNVGKYFRFFLSLCRELITNKIAQF